MKSTNIYFKLKIFAILITLIGFLACDDTKSKIPIVPVDIIIDLNDTQYYKLTVMGGYEYIIGGYSGILVYNNNGEFIAYDRTCPYDIDCGKLYVNEKELDNVADTTCCKSEFSLLYGNVKKGPAVNPLKAYRCFYNENTKILQIKN